ncbi:MAG: hypothetical protein R6U66_14710 [Bacteroidales bacterium]
MKKMESIKNDVFKRFEDVQIDMNECRGKGRYSTGKGYYYDTPCEDFLRTYDNGDYRMEIELRDSI